MDLYELDRWGGFMHGRSLGFNMIPIIKDTKQPCVPWKEYQNRFATNQEIKEWLSKYKDANPAVLCGRLSNLIVLDLDGQEAHDFLKKNFGNLQKTVVVVSPSGPERYHYWFQYPKGIERIYNFASGYDGTWPHVDLKADGGYVLYPGAERSDGIINNGRYQFIRPFAPGDIELAPCPQWLLDHIVEYNENKRKQEDEFLKRADLARIRSEQRAQSKDFSVQNEERRRKAYAAGAVEKEKNKVASAQSGRRNSQLFESAANLGAFVGAGLLNVTEAEDALIAGAVASGLDKDKGGIRQVHATINSGMRAGERRTLVIPPPREEYQRQERPPARTRFVGYMDNDKQTGDILKLTATLRNGG